MSTLQHQRTDCDVSFDLVESDEVPEEEGKTFPPPTFFYLTTGQSFLGIPIKEDAVRTEVLFPYKWELVKAKDESFSRVKPFYPIPVIRVRDSAIAYDAPPIVTAEKAYLLTLLLDRKRHLQRLLHAYGKDPEEYIEFLKKRRMRLENPIQV